MALFTLLRALGRNRVISEYIVTKTADRRSYLREGGDGGRLSATRVQAQIFVDSQVGRGSAVLDLDDGAGPVRDQLEAATQRARAHQGPPWRLRPAAAPARVDIHDPQIDEREDRAAARLFDAARKTAGRPPYETWAQTREVRCIASNGFDNRYLATEVGIRGRVGRGRATEGFEIASRRLRDLDLAAAVDHARRLAARSSQRTPAGRYHMVVRSTAFGDSPLDSIFAPLVQLSDPGRYRLGIGRARLGQQVADPSLSLRSDGTRPFARDSRPFASDGSATRRWAIVESGKLSGLALDNHFGALLGRESNGGVGNLELVMAREPMASLIAPDELPVLVVDAAAWRRADPATGALTMAIRAGRVVRSDGATTDVRGGVASTGSELFDRARGSLEDAISSWFAGPAAIHLGVVSVV